MDPGATLCVLVLFAAGCAPRAAASSDSAVEDAGAVSDAPAGAGQTEQPPVPLVDHHLHLLSRAAAESKFPAIELPTALNGLVNERERLWNDSAGLAELFAGGGALFSGNPWISGPIRRRWVKGRNAIAASLVGGYIGPYVFKPLSYRIDGPVARIAGHMVADDSVRSHFASFHLALSRGADGMWRIEEETQIFPGPAMDEPLTADELVERLDAVGISRGVVMSNAYYFGAGYPDPVPDEYANVRAENDWTAQQVAQFPDRLVAFCSVNPLRHYALAELGRCASGAQFMGLKLHLNGAQLNFRDPEEVEKVRRVMSAANEYGLPMIIHVRSGDRYEREDAAVFLHQLVAAAPDVPIQVAHLWGGESYSGSALAVYADAVAADLPVARNLYFDVSGAWSYGNPEDMAEIRARIRQIGLGRILYASDAPPAEAWAAFRTKLGLNDEEIRTIAGNVAPYMRSSVEGRH